MATPYKPQTLVGECLYAHGDAVDSEAMKQSRQFIVHIIRITLYGNFLAVASHVGATCQIGYELFNKVKMQLTWRAASEVDCLYRFINVITTQFQFFKHSIDIS